MNYPPSKGQKQQIQIHAQNLGQSAHSFDQTVSQLVKINIEHKAVKDTSLSRFPKIQLNRRNMIIKKTIHNPKQLNSWSGITNSPIVQTSSIISCNIHSKQKTKVLLSNIFIPVYVRVKLKSFDQLLLQRLSASVHCQLKICFSLKNLKQYIMNIIKSNLNQRQQVFEQIYKVLTSKVRVCFNKDSDLILDSSKDFLEFQEFQDNFQPDNLQNYRCNFKDENDKTQIYYTLNRKIKLGVIPKNYIWAPFEQILLQLSLQFRCMQKVVVSYQNEKGEKFKHKFSIKFNCMQSNNPLQNINYDPQNTKFGVYKISKNYLHFQSFNKQCTKQRYQQLKLHQTNAIKQLKRKYQPQFYRQSNLLNNFPEFNKIKDGNIQTYIDESQAFLYEERNQQMTESDILNSLKLLGIQKYFIKSDEVNFFRALNQPLGQMASSYLFEQAIINEQKVSNKQDLKKIAHYMSQQLSINKDTEKHKSTLSQAVEILIVCAEKFIKSPTRTSNLMLQFDKNMKLSPQIRLRTFKQRFHRVLGKLLNNQMSISNCDLLFLVVNLAIVFYIKKNNRIKYVSSRQIQIEWNEDIKNLVAKAVSMNMPPSFKQFKYAHFEIEVYKEPFQYLTTTFFTLFLLNLVNLFNFWNGPLLSRTLPIFASSLIAFSALLPTIRRSHTPSRTPMNIFEMLVWASMIPTILKLVHSLIIRDQDPNTYEFEPLNNIWFICSVIITITVSLTVLSIYLMYRCKWKKDYDFQPLVEVSVPFENINKQRWKNQLCDIYFYNHARMFDQSSKYATVDYTQMENDYTNQTVYLKNWRFSPQNQQTIKVQVKNRL